MEPVKSSYVSKSCAEIISSNCVSWAGPTIAGSCGNATVTDVIVALSNQISACCNPSTNTWVDFSTGVTMGGSGIGASYTITGFATDGANNPMYKWTKDGDLSVRGSLSINVIPTITNGQVSVPLVTLSPTLFPANWTANQVILVSVDFNNSSDNGITFAGSAFLRMVYPTGQLFLDYYFIDTTVAPSPYPFIVDFGGTRFNFA